jgi:hypothetical protein
MKHFFIAITLVGLVIAPVSAEGIDLGGKRAEQAAGAAGFSKAGPTTLAATIGTVVKAALSMIGILFMLLIIYAGFLWMTARGEEAKVEKAQDIIRAAVIGLIIVLAAYSITNFIVPALIARTTR